MGLNQSFNTISLTIAMKPPRVITAVAQYGFFVIDFFLFFLDSEGLLEIQFLKKIKSPLL